MKTRTGFVSNSSSSSFIVALPRWADNKEQLAKLIFPDGQTEYLNPFYDPQHVDQCIRSWPIEMVMDELWKQFSDHEPIGVFEMGKELSNGSIYEIDNVLEKEEKRGDFAVPDNERKRFHEIDYDKQNKRREDLAFAYARQFMELNVVRHYASFRFSDQDGPFFSALEHGDLFDNLPHIRISHH